MESNKKLLAQEWLKSAYFDIKAIEAMIHDSELSNIAVFHAQQCVEKSLKGAIELLNISVPKIHSTAKLYGIIKEKNIINIDVDILDKLDDIYIDARYPGALGLMPYGKPTKEDAELFYSFAKDVYEKIRQIIDS
ncbi:MAG: HEPN domain-containing protein [Spirochaetota bacterium]|nr:HEPN domain-containing protein [Spirochaetota bacterium]